MAGVIVAPHHDQVQVGDDLNELAAISHGAEAVVAALIGHPPLVAIVPGTTVGSLGGWVEAAT